MLSSCFAFYPPLSKNHTQYMNFRPCLRKKDLKNDQYHSNVAFSVWWAHLLWKDIFYCSIWALLRGNKLAMIKLVGVHWETTAKKVKTCQINNAQLGKLGKNAVHLSNFPNLAFHCTFLVSTTAIKLLIFWEIERLVLSFFKFRERCVATCNIQAVQPTSKR